MHIFLKKKEKKERQKKEINCKYRFDEKVTVGVWICTEKIK